VSNYSVLDGTGGLLASGRWHTRGKPIDVEDIPVALRYLEIEVPDSAAVETIQPADLGSDWRTRIDYTRGAGDEWLKSRRSALLRVPSAIVSAMRNILIDPTHSVSAEIGIVKVHRYVVDRRLLR
jgi:RES domain-containing protein